MAREVGRSNKASPAFQFSIKVGVMQDDILNARPQDSAKKKWIPCLKCNKEFWSDDAIRIRFCDRCKKGTAWRGSQESDYLFPPDNIIPELKGPAAVGIHKKSLIKGAKRKERKRKPTAPPLRHIKVNKLKKGIS